jgi:hypothetical protein
LLQEGGERALDQPVGRRLRDRLPGAPIDVQARAGIAAGAAGDDFTPLGGQFPKVLELLGCQLACGHEQTLLGLAPMSAVVLILLF